MEIEVEFGAEESAEDILQGAELDADEFLARNALRIVYQTNNFFLPQISEMIKNRETINLRPEYQRRARWTNDQKSRLIESLLLNIPVPPVFFYESDAARYEVMDGQQRLNAIRDFFAGDFHLVGLKVLTPLNGLKYTKFSPRVKRTLERASISAVVLLMESESERAGRKEFTITDIRRLVFDRLNTGGRQLNAQEIRNALNPGPLNKCIIELTRDKLFTQVFGIVPYTGADEDGYYDNPKRVKNKLYSSMRDCELVLRFVALRDQEGIRGSMKAILDRSMESTLSEEQAKELARDFRSRFKFLYDFFDQKPFRIPSKTGNREKISAALYDAAMVALDGLWEDRHNILADKENVLERLNKAMNNGEEYELIVGRQNTADAVKKRIHLLSRIFKPE